MPKPSPTNERRRIEAETTGLNYANGTEVRGAGAAPIYYWQPGYGPHLDRDGDGVGCEIYIG
ncbi:MULTISPECIES: excalibur calcium-binding domain-containing protein [Tessaracoccus]|uniref:excalibur calcium-binding domain-containing protein n=1 Tax=Tessaracoccus TaxID=72763 RepID=UPI00099D00A5|nr:MULTISPECIES: excalibur calcium-binding domain-containing protein [Tessaracoccus]AQX15575.1 hypothetical protein BKM78_06320 [Tessaracoccus sp. T2.5-30]